MSHHTVSGTSASSSSSPTAATADDYILQRRAQSDRASAEIGRRLLQGWAMLADECQNSTCYGVPLVRAPATNSPSDVAPRRECVICGTLYDTDGNPVVTDVPHTEPPTVNTSNAPMADPPSTRTTRSEANPSADGDIMQSCLNSLTEALRCLSERLTALCCKTPLPSQQIKETAEAISATTDALQKVKYACTE